MIDIHFFGTSISFRSKQKKKSKAKQIEWLDVVNINVLYINIKESFDTCVCEPFALGQSLSLVSFWWSIITLIHSCFVTELIFVNLWFHFIFLFKEKTYRNWLHWDSSKTRFDFRSRFWNATIRFRLPERNNYFENFRRKKNYNLIYFFHLKRKFIKSRKRRETEKEASEWKNIVVFFFTMNTMSSVVKCWKKYCCQCGYEEWEEIFYREGSRVFSPRNSEIDSEKFNESIVRIHC